MLVNFNPISNIAKKTVAQILPTKSKLVCSSLKPLSRDVVEFAPQKPVVKSFAAKKLKSFYNSKGVPFLLPHQEWSDKKIMETVKIFGKDLDALVQKNGLNKVSLQELVNKLVPEAKGKIVIKDFSGLRKDLEKLKTPKSDINLFLNSEAIAHSEYKKTTLYFKFDKINNGTQGEVDLKCAIEHELTHAMESRLKNGMLTDDFKNDTYKCFKQKNPFDKFFKQFENTYEGDYPEWEMEVSTQNMLNCLGFDSIKQLHKSFEKTFDLLAASSVIRGDLDLGTDTKSWKQFLNCMKNHALSEKIAYQSNTRYREVSENPAAPTGFELIPLFYDEMAKFFVQKWVEANKFFK